MSYDRDRASAIRALVAPEDIWTLRESAESLLADALRHLPRKEVSEDERRYPTSPEGLRAFLDAFFARHYFQIQDSLIEYIAGPAFESAAQRGSINVADVGSGPAVASLAIADLASAALEVMSKTGKLRGNGAITVHCVLNDTSDICLAEGRTLLERYNRARAGRALIGRILPLSTPFPDSNTHFRRVARMTAPTTFAVWATSWFRCRNRSALMALRRQFACWRRLGILAVATCS